MILLRIAIVAAAIGVTPAWGQQPKTTEQQARSYILSAFMTGAAPTVLSADVKAQPALRLRLAVPAEADSRAIYYAMVRVTAGKSITVRPAKIDELERSDLQVEAGKPVFALDVSESTFALQYDLERDAITRVADASRPVAVTAPVTPAEPPQPIVPAVAEAPKPVAEALKPPAEEPKPAAEAPKPPAEEPKPAAVVPAPVAEPLPGAKVQVIEPREPQFNKPAPVRPVATPQPARETPRLPALKPSGPCVVKPVMSDQDLVNCGARPN